MWDAVKGLLSMIGIQINKPSEPIGDIRELTTAEIDFGENTGNVETRIITIVMVVNTVRNVGSVDIVKAIPLISANVVHVIQNILEKIVLVVANNQNVVLYLE